MAVDVEIDVELLKNEIRKTYAAVCAEPGPRQRPGPARHRPLDRLNRCWRQRTRGSWRGTASSGSRQVNWSIPTRARSSRTPGVKRRSSAPAERRSRRTSQACEARDATEPGARPRKAHTSPLCADSPISAIGASWNWVAATAASRSVSPPTQRVCSPSIRTPRQSSGRAASCRPSLPNASPTASRRARRSNSNACRSISSSSPGHSDE